MVLQVRHAFVSRGALFCNWAVLFEHLILTDNFWSLSVSWKQCADASCFGSVVFASIGSYLCSDIYKSAVSCITVTFYCISTQRRISPRTFCLHMENGRRTAVCWDGPPGSHVLQACLRHLPQAPNTGSVSQTHPFSAQLRNSSPSHSAQQQPAGFVGLVSSEVSLSGHPHVWQALLVHKEPDSSRPGGPVTFTLSGSNCSPASGKDRNFCQLNSFICLNDYNPRSSWCSSLSGNNLWKSIWENYLLCGEIQRFP